jgi:hypothetical protein
MLGQGGVRIAYEYDLDPRNLRPPEDMAVEGRRLEERARLPALQAKGSQAQVLARPVLMVGESIGVRLREGAFEDMTRERR